MRENGQERDRNMSLYFDNNNYLGILHKHRVERSLFIKKLGITESERSAVQLKSKSRNVEGCLKDIKGSSITYILIRLHKKRSIM